MVFCFEISKHFGQNYILIDYINATRFIARTGHFNGFIDHGIGNPMLAGRLDIGSCSSLRFEKEPRGSFVKIFFQTGQAPGSYRSSSTHSVLPLVQ
jgi:hypothetical protein